MTAPDSSVVAGMGDEVLAFLVTLLLGGTVLLAWWSTAVRERPRVRAVLVQPIRPGVVVAEQVDEAEARNRQREAGGEVVFAEGARETAGRDEEEEGEEEERQEEGGEQGRREAEAATAEEVCNTRQGSAATAAAGAAGTAEEARPEAAEGDSSDSSSSSTPPITIKLKFLNDSQREVRARPSESLGRFKRRHFAEALADNKVVRLIFNGQMLSGDRESLGHYGLFDNCVVHCLVSSGQEARRRDSVGAVGGQGSGATYPGEHDDGLDLSHICYPLLGSLLLMLWWCQIVYSHYFSVASTMSLVSLTVLFLASITNTYLY